MKMDGDIPTIVKKTVIGKVCQSRREIITKCAKRFHHRRRPRLNQTESVFGDVAGLFFHRLITRIFPDSILVQRLKAVNIPQPGFGWVGQKSAKL